MLNQTEASFFSRMERVGGFGGKADQLNAYSSHAGNPDYFAEDLARYHALQPNDIQAAVRRWLLPDNRLELSVVPAQKRRSEAMTGSRFTGLEVLGFGSGCPLADRA